MSKLSRRTKAVTAAAATVAALAATGSGIAAAAPSKPTGPPASTQNLGSYDIVQTPPGTVAGGGYVFTTAACPAGESVLGGGGSNSDGNGAVVLTDSRPTGSGAWSVWYKNNGPSEQTVSAWAVCGS